MNSLSPLPSVSKVWSAIPAPLQKALLAGGEGSPRLLRLAQQHLPLLETHPAHDLLLRIFADIFVCAWEGAMLDPQAADALAQVQTQFPNLFPGAAGFVTRCAKAQARNKQDAKQAEDLLMLRDVAGAQDFLDKKRHSEPGNIFWLGFARYLGLNQAELAWYEPWLDAYDLPLPIAHIFKGDWRFALRDFVTAAAHYQEAYEQIPLPGILVRQGECLHAMGRRKEALDVWQRALTERPWQINLFLRLTDCLQGHDVPGAPPEGQGCILLYSWNHGPDLEETLAALTSSNLGTARIIALNNGSSDNTAALLKGWSQRLGEKFSTITLPVNIGAPAARNWLLADPRVKSADWAVFLDDDALVPEDWLGYFGTAARANPEAGIIGCRVVDKDSPLTMQSVDMHFEATDSAKRQNNHPGNNILVGHTREADFGQYSYLRPCVSVTGCCHLFTRKSMDKTGGFDLRFSPSQFDDFERDLRSGSTGEMPLYQGHLAVRHIRRHNPLTGMTPWQQANVAGNLVTLWRSYPPAMVEEIINFDLRSLNKDLQARFKIL